MEESSQVPGYQEPLVRRHDLSPELGRKLYWAVSAALRQAILEKFDLDPGDIDEAMEAAVNDAMGRRPTLSTSKAHHGDRPNMFAMRMSTS